MVLLDANLHSEKRDPVINGTVGVQECESKEHDLKRNELREDERHSTNGEIDEFAVIADGEQQTLWLIWLLVSCCSISGLLFGMFTQA